MGATTYRLMAEFAARGEEGVDQALTPVSKVVFSSTLTEPLVWANTRLVTGDAVETVRAMKEESRIEMRTLGSVSLCRSLITAGLVDRFRVVVFPVITGATGQDRIYDGYPDVRLNLVKAALSTEGSNCWSTCLPCSRSAGCHGSGELSEALDSSPCAPECERRSSADADSASASLSVCDAALVIGFDSRRARGLPPHPGRPTRGNRT